MTKTKLLVIGMALALVTWVGASAASADNHGPSITVDPTSVSAAGQHTFTVTGSGWTVSLTNVLPCKIPEGANGAEIDASVHCTSLAVLDIQNMRPTPVTNGGFEVEISIDVPEQGIFIMAGDTARTESAEAVLITVGSMGDGDMDDSDDMTPDGDMADDMDDSDDMGDEDMADDMDGDELADTGSNTPLLAIISLAVVLAGAMVLGLSRRLRTQ